MDTARLIGQGVTADPGVVGEGFPERLARRLDAALAASGRTLAEFEAGREAEDIAGSLAEDTLSARYDGPLEEMEAHVCLGRDYPVTSHRPGPVGALARGLKRAVMAFKLRADPQVGQQARFNLATFVATQTAVAQAGQLEILGQAVRRLAEEQRQRIAEQDAVIASLREEIEALRKRIDGR